MIKNKVLFLVEAGSASGLGHLRRMQVLASTFEDKGWICNFSITDSLLIEHLKAEGFSANLWTGNGLDLGVTDVLIVDGYQYNSSLIHGWKDFCKVSVVIDDMADKPLSADFVLNHNIYGDTLDYSKYKINKLLTGPSFSLVDSRFLKVSNIDKPSMPHILVTFGGTDDGKLSAEVVSNILNENRQIVIELVTSPLCNPSSKITKLAGVFPDRLIIHNGADMVEVMERCNLVIGAAGFTIIEALAAGLTPIVCAIADNQKYNIKALKSLGVKANYNYDVEWLVRETLLALDSPSCQKNSVLDGQGAQRVFNSIEGYLLEGLN